MITGNQRQKEQLRKQLEAATGQQLTRTMTREAAVTALDEWLDANPPSDESLGTEDIDNEIRVYRRKPTETTQCAYYY